MFAFIEAVAITRVSWHPQILASRSRRVISLKFNRFPVAYRRVFEVAPDALLLTRQGVAGGCPQPRFQHPWLIGFGRSRPQIPLIVPCRPQAGLMSAISQER